jgi:hypothetical protein
MHKGIKRFLHLILVAGLSTALTLVAEPLPQNPQEPAPTQSSPMPADTEKPQPATGGQNKSDSANAPSGAELPDAPTPAQPGEQTPQPPPPQTQNSGSVPSGAAAAKAAPAKGAPASRPVGAAIAPAKQRERRSLLIKVGLVAGACVAVGSVVALSKASPSKPPGAP